MFEPTITLFSEAITVSYKKVGTRFLRLLSVGNQYFQNTNNKQIDIVLKPTRTILSTNHFKNERTESKIPPHRWLKWGLTDKYICMPWHDGGQANTVDTFDSDLKFDDAFLKWNKVSNYNEFFLENGKPLVFIIRNPIKRLFSGLSEIVKYGDEGTMEELLKNHWSRIMSDVHSENYLHHFKFWIENIKDKSKIVVLDLEELRTEKAKEFFLSIGEEKNILEHYEFVEQRRETNESDYKSLLQKFENAVNREDFKFFDIYLKDEKDYYLELKNSKYYLNLK